jgi:hypothetical protein
MPREPGLVAGADDRGRLRAAANQRGNVLEPFDRERQREDRLHAAMRTRRYPPSHRVREPLRDRQAHAPEELKHVAIGRSQGLTIGFATVRSP